jgi:hypothetical protein
VLTRISINHHATREADMAKSHKQGRRETGGGNGSGMQKASVGGGSQGADAGKKQDAEALLRADHRKVEELFRKFDAAGDEESSRKEKEKLTGEICKELVIHSRLEEEIFYAACRQKGVEDDALDEAQVEHDSLKLLIGDLLQREPGSAFYDAKVKVLSEYVKHHVTEEEKATSGIFAKARAAGVDMDSVGERILRRKEQLREEMQSGVTEAPRPRSLSVATGAFNRPEDDRRMFGSRYSESRGAEDDARYRRRGGYTERAGDQDPSAYQERSRRSEPRYWDERDRAGGYYGSSSRRSYGGTERYEGDYGGGYSRGDEYFSGSRGYTGSAYSGGRNEGESDWSTRSMGGSREGYGRSGRGSFEREGSEYGQFMGNEDRGRMGERNRGEDDESYTRGGGRARFGNRSGNYSNYADDDESDSSRRRRGSEYEGRGGRSGGTGGWRSRE